MMNLMPYDYLIQQRLITLALGIPPEFVVKPVMIVLSVLPMIPVCILLSKYIIKAGPIIDGAING